ncbi:interleukin-21 receptor [Esox lucius]|uniref:Fibronectin type-III domain-containing protein n=1 Tax=Esox lucius TaxID=8010 RepID=A0A3P8Z0R0_ESOLU|nr:interleukin-21 receptor [Esox lucius]
MAGNRMLTASLVLGYVIQYIACSCNITCTTDYETSLNCSCSGIVASDPIFVEANCSDFEGHVNGSCEITPLQNWCIIQPDDLWLYLSCETYCTARVKHTGKDKTEQDESTNWKLHESVKPRTPFNVSVTRSFGKYNVTWEMHENMYLKNSLMYMVHITEKNIPLKNYLLKDQMYLELRSLQPETEYVAKVCASPKTALVYSGHWSEWSASVEWRTIEWRTTGGNDLWWLTIVPCLILFCLLKIMWPKSYTPNPEVFFKPLYHTYEGDFKKWVGPIYIFSELEPLGKNPPAQMMTEKQLNVLGLSRLSVVEDSGHNTSTDQDTCHSAGHISIDTVMVSGEEGPVSGSSWETYRNRHAGGSFSSYTGSSRGGMDSGAKGSAGSGEDEEVRLSGQRESRESIELPEWQLQVQACNYGPEQISLDSEDGYPPMGLDLDSVDTIDSGVFVESDCSSPVNSNYDSEEQKNSLLNGVDIFRSNYVKQWVTDDTVQGEATSS